VQLAQLKLVAFFQYDLRVIDPRVPYISLPGFQLIPTDQVLHRHAQNTCNARNEMCGDAFVDPIDEIAQTRPIPTNSPRKAALCQGTS
jgi:hypothetical protein